jgi:hypothetical protein
MRMPAGAEATAHLPGRLLQLAPAVLQSPFANGIVSCSPGTA